MCVQRASKTENLNQGRQRGRWADVRALLHTPFVFILPLASPLHPHHPVTGRGGESGTRLTFLQTMRRHGDAASQPHISSCMLVTSSPPLDAILTVITSTYLAFPLRPLPPAWLVPPSAPITTRQSSALVFRMEVVLVRNIRVGD